MVNSILVLGGGSAGFLAAITLKRRLPAVDVLVVRSPELRRHRRRRGDDGRRHAPPARLPRASTRTRSCGRPTRSGSSASASTGAAGRGSTMRSHSRWTSATRPCPSRSGTYAGEDITDFALRRRADEPATAFSPGVMNGSPAVDAHLRLPPGERHVRRLAGADGRRGRRPRRRRHGRRRRHQGEAGVTGLVLADGRTVSADLFVDCSGFRSVAAPRRARRAVRRLQVVALVRPGRRRGGWDRQAGRRDPAVHDGRHDGRWGGRGGSTTNTASTGATSTARHT